MSFDDCIEIIIEKPKEEQDRLRQVLKDWQAMQLVEDSKITLFMVVANTYLNNLMNRKQKPKISEVHKSEFGYNCIIFYQFSMYLDALSTRHIGTKITGNINIICNFEIDEIMVNVYLIGLNIESGDHLYGCLKYEKHPDQWGQLSYEMQPIKDKKYGWCFRINKADRLKVLTPHLVIEIRIMKQTERSSKLVGINNEGNTCYMNSIIQVLFFFKPFRKIIMESSDDSVLLTTLKDLFLNLMYPQYSKDVDAQALIEAIGLFDEFPRRQQDIHEFIVAFFDLIAQKCPQVKEFWSGKGQYTIESKDPSKPYSCNHQDEFNELDAHMDSPTGTPFQTVFESLQHILALQKVDQLIDTPQHGKIPVYKLRRIDQLPQILFINIKRYEYEHKHRSLKKVLSNLEYSSHLDLSSLVGTPENNELNYLLYAVTVHKGMTPFSGHYYSLVNVSNKINKPQWHEFNDSLVKPSSQKLALSFSGCKKKKVIFNKQYHRLEKVQVDSDDTAYLLVYIRQNIFEDYQSLPINISKQTMNKMMKKHPKENLQKNQQIQVFVVNPSINIDLFATELQTITIPLNLDEPIFDQLVKLLKKFLRCNVGSIWKVSRPKKIIKHIDHQVKVSRIFKYRRGHCEPDYILVMPKSESEQKIGVKSALLQIVSQSQKQFLSLSAGIHIIQKQQLLSMMDYKRTMQVQNILQFELDWNDYFEITLD